MISLIDLYLTNIVDISMSLTRLRRKPWRFAFYALTRGLTYVTLAVLLVSVWELGVKGILVASLTAACLVFVVSAREYVSDLTRRLDWSVGREMVSFGWPTIVSAFAFYGLNLADRFIVRAYHGAAETGLYAVAFRYSQIVLVGVFAFRMGWPQWHYSWLNTERHPEMVARGANWFFGVIGFLVVLVSAWILPIFHLLMPEKFWGATEAVPPSRSRPWVRSTTPVARSSTSLGRLGLRRRLAHRPARRPWPRRYGAARRAHDRARSRAALVRLVRVQCGLRAGRQRPCCQRPLRDQHRGRRGTSPGSSPATCTDAGERPRAAAGAVAGLVAITPASGFVAAGGAVAIGLVAGRSATARRCCASGSGSTTRSTSSPCTVSGARSGRPRQASSPSPPSAGASGPSRETPAGPHPARRGHGHIPVRGHATFVIVKVVNLAVGLRVSEADEALGLDVTQHGEVAYGASR